MHAETCLIFLSFVVYQLKLLREQLVARRHQAGFPGFGTPSILKSKTFCVRAMCKRVEEEVDVHQRSEKKKKKKRNDANIVDGGATKINVEDIGVKSRKKHGKKKGKGEERDEGVFVGLEDKEKNDFRIVVTEEKRNRKKAKRNNMGDNDGGFDRDCEINEYKSDPNGKSQYLKTEKVGRSSNKIRNDMEFGDKVIMLETVKDDEKKRKKEKKNNNIEAIYSYSTEIIKDRKVGKDKKTHGLENCERGEILDMKQGDGRDILKKKKNKDMNKVSNGKNIDKEKDHVGGCCVIEVVHLKKNKKGRNKYRDDAKHYNRETVKKLVEENCVALDDDMASSHGHLSTSSIKQKRDGERESLVEMENLDHIERKKAKSIKDDVGEKIVDLGESRTKIRSNQNADDFKINSGHRKPDKRVKFSSNVEVFPASNGVDVEEENQEKKSCPRKWYSQEEDKMIKDAVFNFIEMCCLGEEGLEMVMNVKSYPQIRNCWKDICVALPWRSRESVRHRAHTLFNKDEGRKWTPNEKESVKKFHQDNGPQWRTLEKEHGKAVVHVKDTRHRIKPLNLKKGPWSQEEYQTLSDLVNTDLRMKAYEERKSNNLLLRDNISWEAVSTKMGTRTTKDCFLNWYRKLAPSLVKDGKWAPVDDYHLVNALFTLDACCMEDVNWDDLIPNRPGDVCRKRFKQMCNELGKHGLRYFSEQVDMLANRYGADMLEIKENANHNTLAE